MTDMRVNIAGVELKNPIVTASGTFGFAEEYALYTDLSRLGGIALKALTREPRLGNPPVRIAETASGVLNSVGLQNPGVDEFLRTTWLRIKEIDTVKIANIAGACVEDYIYVAERLNDTGIDLFEVNVSCPNVKHGGVNFGTDEKTLRGVVEEVKKVSKKPLIVKLTPNVTHIADMAKAAADGGADVLSLINTITGMAINAVTRKPVLANVTGGLSGPAVKPVALRMVWEVYRANLGLPIIGMGGIMTGEDAAEFMIAGADAVMVGTATMRNPSAAKEIGFELEQFADKIGLERIGDLTGSLNIE
ncbi:dihydroorotate dehydrogenase [Christensenella tenuis]|jgi:dihydroorotate dehydrogenase (NAD+) catalytic subunit|uniref:Dihydroorotate dehydrogenase n=1 Tax=Christensenella tenuis TaxID=2763033 RepID=A0ABR7EAZ1_9FIRM|nr:dihydroorotate dehydrogenase [Christensenella tenuis]MBC5646932.1 dihydroorotate dehydrogenase [Christensenella tenuis]